MEIIEVKDISARKAFLNLPRMIYKDDPNWVCPLDNDIESVFDPARNHFHEHGKCTRWILKDDQGKVIGRIAAFVNDKKAYKFEKPTGGAGFFECIDSQQAADVLFDTAKKWLIDQGMQAMDAPVNFGENDMWWGLLVDGYTTPSYGMNYHAPYYKRLFERYGFVPSYEQISNRIDIHKPFPERFTKIAEWVSKKPGYNFEHLEKSKFDRFAKDFLEIYNDAWKDFENFTPITEQSIRESFQKLKPIMDERLIWFSYVNGEPASLVVIVPDANELIKNLNGKLNFFGKLKFALNKYGRKNKKMRAIIMGTKSKFQKHGLESAMFIKLKEYVLPLNQYVELELSWVGDFNTKMIAIHEATGATFSKKHITYRLEFK
ncbi:MAG: N-acetyltransferase [Bacteroidetes bacterium]|nr:MAG: N-acetyltransferase [Bacteroidota bacterium]